jgi:hypothetical protein
MVASTSAWFVKNQCWGQNLMASEEVQAYMGAVQKPVSKLNPGGK